MPWTIRKHDQVVSAGTTGQPVDRQQQRGRRVDHEPEVVDPHAPEHVPEPAEAHDQDAPDDHVAEDHPQQVEAVRRHERIEVDAAEDVRHRDQRDRYVERREQDRERRVRERDPLVAVVHSRSIIQVTCAVCLYTLPGCPRPCRSRACGQRAARGSRAAGPPAARGAPFPLSHGSVLGRLDREGAQSVSDLAQAERVRPQSMAQTVSELETTASSARSPDPERPAAGAGRAHRAGPRDALRRIAADARGLARQAIAEDLTARGAGAARRAVELLRRIAES